MARVACCSASSACRAQPRPSTLLQKRRSCNILRRAAASEQPKGSAAAATAAEGAPQAAPAAAQAVEEVDGAGAVEMEEEEDLLELPEAQFIIVQPDFLGIAPELRQHYEQRVGNPLRATADRFCFDYWHVPEQYTLLRTPANAFFPRQLYDQLEDALIEYGERQLGCRGISPLWLSYYVHGCRQEWHCDAPHGPFAFVLSLTKWDERRFSGGETMILQPHVLDYWRSFDPSKGTETPQLVTYVPARFGQLTVFDPRLPHGVRQVEGTHDPLDARVVLHGWFTQPSPFFAGSLSEEEATPALNACLDRLYEALGALPPAVGTVTLRLEVAGESGRVKDIQWLANTLVARPQSGEQPWDVTDATLAAIAEHCFAATFPASSDGGGTSITLPFVFE